MASPAEIAQTAPATLPADFSEWDSAGPPSTLPASSSAFKADSDAPAPVSKAQVRAKAAPVAEPKTNAPANGSKTASAPAPKTPAQPKQPRVAPAQAAAKPRKNPALMPAAAYADSNAFYQMEALQNGMRSDNKNRNITVSVIASASVLLLVMLAPLIYPKIMSRVSIENQSVSAHPMAETPDANLKKPHAATAMTAVAAKDAQQDTTDTEEADTPQVQSEMMNNQLAAPTRIPQDIKRAPEKEASPAAGFATADLDGLGANNAGAVGAVFSAHDRPNVKAETPWVVNISAGVAGGLVVTKSAPVYPDIAKTARVSGTVVLGATISKTGSIQGLHVISGPVMLRQSALDAVRTWRYKPYRLNNEPVDVETTVDVVFSLGK